MRLIKEGRHRAQGKGATAQARHSNSANVIAGGWSHLRDTPGRIHEPAHRVETANGVLSGTHSYEQLILASNVTSDEVNRRDPAARRGVACDVSSMSMPISCPRRTDKNGSKSLRKL
jgi:hypothetical protein